MTYPETIEFLYTKLPMFSRMGSAAIKKDLTNTLQLCALSGDPHKKFKSIHVAGTNGKGSVSHMLAAIFQNAGYKTGLYTSPHLYDFRERIRINGEMIPERNVVDYVERIKENIIEIEPSFFEITVAMAFDHFANEQVDIAIVEVGLGGRLDSTNIITPELSIITHIGLDHTQLLGNTIEEIAAEKAGIIKENVPVVTGAMPTKAMHVIKQVAAEKNATVYDAPQHYKTITYSFTDSGMDVAIQDLKTSNIKEFVTDMGGIYQAANIPVVFTAFEVLAKKGWQITEQDVDALEHVKTTTGLIGRWDIIRKHPMVVMEVAHNEDGIKQMLDHLKQLKYGNLHFVFGMVKDKDIDPILSLLPAKACYYFAEAHIPRALPAKDLKQQASKKGLKGNFFTDVNKATEAALKAASENDIVIICGSIFLVAEVNRDVIRDSVHPSVLMHKRYN